MNILNYLRRVALASPHSDLRDGELLEAFVARRDGACFEALVRRHGPMVLGVCQRVLRDPHDAEDAFQAVFLVLVRKAAAIPRAAVGNWLYGVAYRTALNARRAAARRRAKERTGDDMPHPTTAPADPWPELRPLLDDELSRLPDKYRSAVVLCDIEGLTRAEAAHQLGVPAGTVSGRLTTARRMLAARLTRRGLTLPAAGLGVLLPQVSAPTVSPALHAAAVRAGEAVAAGTAAGAVAPQITGLADGVGRGLSFAKWKLILLPTALAIPMAGAFVVTVVRGPGNVAAPDGIVTTARPAEFTAREKLQGEWQVVKAESNGESVLDPAFTNTRLVFAGDRFIFRQGNEDRAGTYQLDAAAPMTLTLTFAPDSVMDCIWEATATQMKLCWRKGGAAPAGFDTTRERDTVLFVTQKQ
jgi:RNA polymerase sigma factor (sigma-70 family)